MMALLVEDLYELGTGGIASVGEKWVAGSIQFVFPIQRYSTKSSIARVSF